MQLREPPCVDGVASHPVQGTAAGGGDQPSQRLLRVSALRPGAQRRLHRLLGGDLGQLQDTETAHQGGPHSGLPHTEGPRTHATGWNAPGRRVRTHGAQTSSIGRISTRPPIAPGHFAAQARASSREPTSITTVPPTNSRLSAYGPAVITGSASRVALDRLVPSSGSVRPKPPASTPARSSSASKAMNS